MNQIMKEDTDFVGIKAKSKAEMQNLLSSTENLICHR